MSAGRHASYPRAFFPGIVLIGLGLSVFVTPLTATVMAAVPEGLVGVASGVSNTITRVASLLAIAVLGIVVAQQFGATLASTTAHLPIGPRARHSLNAHRDLLAEDPEPGGLTPAQRTAVRTAIDDAFIDGYRLAVLTCAGLCLSSAAISALMIRDRHEPAGSGAAAAASG
jgi:hypothetical protein